MYDVVDDWGARVGWGTRGEEREGEKQVHIAEKEGEMAHKITVRKESMME